MLLLFVPADLHACSFYSFSQLLCFLVRKLAEIRGLEYVGSTEKEGMKSWYATCAIIWQWAICVAVIGNPNIPNFLNVSYFFPFCRSVLRCNRHFSVSRSWRWLSCMCPTCQQPRWQEDALQDNHFLRQPSKFSVILGRCEPSECVCMRHMHIVYVVSQPGCCRIVLCYTTPLVLESN